MWWSICGDFREESGWRCTYTQSSPNWDLYRDFCAYAWFYNAYVHFKDELYGEFTETCSKQVFRKSLSMVTETGFWEDWFVSVWISDMATVRALCIKLLLMWRLLSITSQQKKTDDVIDRKWLDFALVFPETTWERPSSTPGTPKTPVKHKNSVPTGEKCTFTCKNHHLYIIQKVDKNACTLCGRKESTQKHMQNSKHFSHNMTFSST